MKVTKSQLKELIKHSIVESPIMKKAIKKIAPHIKDVAKHAAAAAGEKAAEKVVDKIGKKKKVKESKKRRFTVKEVRMWMKKLEENRYKKVYNSDARRVAWMVNNEGVSLDEMPISMKKKWTKAQYGRERYLAKEFLQSKSEQMNEGKLTEASKKWSVKVKDIGYVLVDAGGASEAKRLVAKKLRGGIKDILGVTKALPSKKVSNVGEQKLRESIRKIIKEQMNEGKLNEFLYAKLGPKVEKFVKQKKMSGTDLPIWKVELIYKDQPRPQHSWIRGKTAKDAIKVAKSNTKGIDVKVGKAIFDDERWLKVQKNLKTGFKEQKLRESIRGIIKKQLNEQKFKKVILPNDMKTKVKVSKMIKQLKLKIDKDYDVKALKARGGDQVISILPKHYNKFIELAMKNKLNPRG